MKVGFDEFFQGILNRKFWKKLCKIYIEKLKISCKITNLLSPLWNFLKMFETCCLVCVARVFGKVAHVHVKRRDRKLRFSVKFGFEVWPFSVWGHIYGAVDRILD